MHLMTHCLNLLTFDKASEEERLESLIVAMFFLLPGRHAGEGGDVDEILQGLVDEKKVQKLYQDRFNCDSSFDLFYFGGSSKISIGGLIRDLNQTLPQFL